MGQGELIAPADWSKTPTNERSVAVPAEGAQASDRFRSEQFQAQMRSPAADKGERSASEKVEEKRPTIVNQGQIKEMNLPLGWQETTAPKDQNVLRSERIFRPKGPGRAEEKEAKVDGAAVDENNVKVLDKQIGTNSAELVFFYSGRPNDEADGRAFRGILQKPAHKLSADELKTLERTLGDLSDKESFQLSEASTRDVNGKRVLDMKGTWLFNKNQYHGMLIDADGTGQVVQQIYLMAPPSGFANLNKDFEDACKTIKWR